MNELFTLLGFSYNLRGGMVLREGGAVRRTSACDRAGGRSCEPSPERGHGAWGVAQTRARAGKKVLRSYLRRGGAADLRLVDRSGWTQGGRLRREVAQRIEAPDPLELESYLRALHGAIGGGLPVFPGERLRGGQAVEVVSGQFAGLIGHVRQVCGRLRVSMVLWLLQISVEVEMEARDVVPVHTEAVVHAAPGGAR